MLLPKHPLDTITITFETAPVDFLSKTLLKNPKYMLLIPPINVHAVKILSGEAVYTRVFLRMAYSR
jgi:hypothetical protein